MIIDYSTARPSMAALRAAGVTAAGRYIGYDCEPGFGCIHKNLTAAEAAQLHAAGISVFLSFEYAADAAKNGASQGTADGKLATRQLADLGAPASMGVYFAVDYDDPDDDSGLPDTKANAKAKLGPVARYFAAINALKPHYRVGVYGGYYAVKRVLDAGLATLAWQTVAWSGGQRDLRAQLYQTTGSQPIGGADLDIHESTATDFGQWTAPAVKAGPPTLQQGMTGPAVKALQLKLNAHGYHLAVDGVYGPATKAAVLSFQKQHALTADGVAGPLTWAKLT